MPSTTTGEAPLLTVKDVCKLLNVSERFVYRRTERGSSDPIPFLRVGGFLRFRREALDAWLNARESA